MSDHQNGLEKEVVDSALRKSHNKIPKTDVSRFIVIGRAPRRLYGHEFPRDPMNQVSHRWLEEGRLLKRGEDLMDQERSRRIRLYGGDRELTLEEILNLNAGFAPEWNCRLK